MENYFISFDGKSFDFLMEEDNDIWLENKGKERNPPALTSRNQLSAK